MSLVKLTLQDTIMHPLRACGTVKLCLDPSWAAKTVSGQASIIASVDNSVRNLGGLSGVLHRLGKWNARRSAVIQYTLYYDDAQITDPVADVITCADITKIDPYC